MEPELDRFWPRLNPVCENPRFQPPPALLKIEQLTFTSSGLPRIDAKCGDHCLQADFQGNIIRSARG